MLRAHPKIQRQVLQLLDVGVTVASFALAFLIRSKVLIFLPAVYLTHWDRYALPAMLVGVLWWIGFRWQNTYVAQRFTSLRTELNRVLRTAGLGTLVFVGLLYLLRWSFVPRTLVLTFVPVNIVLLFFNRVLIYGVIQTARRKGYDRKRVLVVGTGDQARRFMETVAGHLEWGLDIVGFVGPPPVLLPETGRGNVPNYAGGSSSPPQAERGRGRGSVELRS